MDHNKSQRLGTLQELFGSSFDKVFNKTELDAFLTKLADDCECDDCKTRKALASSYLDLKKRLAKFDGVYESLLSKMGLTEADLEKHNVRFTFFAEQAPGFIGTIKDDKGVKHWVINVSADMLGKFYANAFEINCAADARYAADEADIAVVECLAHELQHLKQYVSGQMKDTKEGGDNVVYWDGERHELKFGMRTDDKFLPSTPEEREYYKNLPWEVDARDVAERVTDELIAAGRLPNRPPKRKKKSQSSLIDDIIGPAITSIIGKLKDKAAAMPDGQTEVTVQGHDGPLDAANARDLLKLIESGRGTVLGTGKKRNGDTEVLSEAKARSKLIAHLKTIIAKDETNPTVH